MSKETGSFDLNQFINGKVIVMGLLVFFSSYMWTEASKSRERYEKIIIENSESINTLIYLTRGLNIRLLVIERELNIEPLEKP